MADRKFQLQFSARWRNEVKVKNLLLQAELATGWVYSKKRLERLLVTRVKNRFTELGQTKVSQRNPDGTLWREVAPATLDRHVNPNRILFKSGALMRSITSKNSRMESRTLASATGGGFRIGVAENEPRGAGSRKKPSQYARYHQRGIRGKMAARRFLGIGKGDVQAVEDFIQRGYKQFGIIVR